MTKIKKPGQEWGWAPNNVIYDKNLSAKAKGLFVYINAKPEGYDFSSERIAMEMADGRDSIRAGLKELEDCGYLVRIKTRTKDGRYENDYELVLSPAKGSTGTDYPAPENPTPENPSSNKDIQIKKEGEERKITKYADDFLKQTPPVANFEKVEDIPEWDKLPETYRKIYYSLYQLGWRMRSDKTHGNFRELLKSHLLVSGLVNKNVSGFERVDDKALEAMLAEFQYFWSQDEHKCNDFMGALLRNFKRMGERLNKK